MTECLLGLWVEKMWVAYPQGWGVAEHPKPALGALPKMSKSQNLTIPALSPGLYVSVQTFMSPPQPQLLLEE